MGSANQLPLIAVVLRRCAKEQGLQTQAAFAKHFGLKPSTLSDWWNGKSVPKKRSDRATLFNATKHPMFTGPFVAAKKAMALKLVDVQAEMDPAVFRISQLLPVVLRDLGVIVSKENPEARIALRTLVGPNQLEQLLNASRAIVNETSWKKLFEEGAFPHAEGMDS